MYAYTCEYKYKNKYEYYRYKCRYEYRYEYIYINMNMNMATTAFFSLFILFFLLFGNVCLFFCHFFILSSQRLCLEMKNTLNMKKLMI